MYVDRTGHLADTIDAYVSISREYSDHEFVVLWQKFGE